MHGHRDVVVLPQGKLLVHASSNFMWTSSIQYIQTHHSILCFGDGPTRERVSPK